MKTITTIGALAITLGTFALGITACSVQEGPADETSSDEDEQTAEVEQSLVTCSTDCSATGGPSITKTCKTCSATSSSITCNGVKTYCQAPSQTCLSKCSYGVCSACDDEGFQTTCYEFNGCGFMYPIP